MGSLSTTISWFLDRCSVNHEDRSPSLGLQLCAVFELFTTSLLKLNTSVLFLRCIIFCKSNSEAVANEHFAAEIKIYYFFLRI